MANYEIINGDCVEVLACLPEASVHLTVTSPPYDNLRTYGHNRSFDDMLFGELFRITAPGGVVVWVVRDASINGSETGTSFRHALAFMDAGFKLHDTMIWIAERPPLTQNRYEQEFEYMFVFCKGKLRTFNGIRTPCKYAGCNGGNRSHRDTDGIPVGNCSPGPVRDTKLLGNVWRYGVGDSKSSMDKIAFLHPAIFPEKLAEDHILSWSNPGDTVLDPFVGSGTTGKMAIVSGRDFIGIDISPEYCAIANERLALYV